MTRDGALYRALESELAAGLRALPDKPEETIDATLAALWHAAAGHAVSAEGALEGELPAIDGAATERLRALVRQRMEGAPLAHLTGRQRFMGLELLAGNAALIPRKETEILARAACARLREIAGSRGEALAIDVCTGSGNLALALADAEPRARVWGADLSGDAVALAARNAEHLGLAARVSFRAGDLLAPFETPEFEGRVDLLVCNPPYISSAKVGTMPAEIIGHEPRLAFDGGPLGIRILNRLLQAAPRFLRPGGWLAFEVGLGQGPGIRQRLAKQGTFDEIQSFEDAAGQVRALAARRAGEGAGGRA